ncbi:hypothetical protein AC249_AIPGENE8480 [Exaiptasia diaphana]|nr:hypothetical protein AC249_AIPGENE8480 [Exaiptasia diaphana]
MTEDTARYLIVRDSEDKGVALSHFRFDLDENMDEVIYWYQVDETSPNLWDPTEEYSYEILSKPLLRKAQTQDVKAN